MLVWHLLTSAMVSLVLLALLRGTHVFDGAILMAGFLLFLLITARMRRVVDNHIRVGYRSKVARRLVIPLVAILLTLVLTVTRLFYPQPYLIDMAWSEVLQQYVTSRAGDSLLGSLERGALVFEIATLWVIQNSIEQMGLGNSKVRVLVWLLYFLTQGALAWAFIRLLTGQAALKQYLQTIRSE